MKKLTLHHVFMVDPDSTIDKSHATVGTSYKLVAKASNEDGDIFLVELDLTRDFKVNVPLEDIVTIDVNMLFGGIVSEEDL